MSIQEKAPVAPAQDDEPNWAPYVPPDQQDDVDWIDEEFTPTFDATESLPDEQNGAADEEVWKHRARA